MNTAKPALVGYGRQIAQPILRGIVVLSQFVVSIL